MDRPSELIDYDFDPVANVQNEIQALCLDADPSPQTVAISRTLPAYHGTKVERLASIIRDGLIASYRELQDLHPEVLEDRMQLSTDELDVELGLHNFVFFSIGRMSAGIDEEREAYVCFPSDIYAVPGAFVALREIVHFGALVSPEAKRVYKRRLPGANVDLVNRGAIKKFFKQLVRAEDFPDLFARFLEKYYALRGYREFLSDGCFPTHSGMFMSVHDEPSRGWEGPQLILPQTVDLQGAHRILVVDDVDHSRKVHMATSGVDLTNVLFLSDLIPYFERYNNTSLAEVFSQPRKRYLGINIVLHELMCDLDAKGEHLVWLEECVEKSRVEIAKIQRMARQPKGSGNKRMRKRRKLR